jgi:hypothetical protein
MPLKPRDQWKPNVKLQTAREEAFGKKSRARFAGAVKRRCQELYGGHCGVDHRTVRRWEEGACEPDVCHQQAICDVLCVPWEERDRLGFPVPVVDQSPFGEPVPARGTGLVAAREPIIGESAPSVTSGFALVNGQRSVCGGQNGTPSLTGSLAGHGKEDDANRGEANRLLGMAALSFALPETPVSLGAQLMTALQHPRYLDTKALDDLQALVTDFGRRALYTPPAELFDEVGPRLWQLIRLLDEPLRDAHRQRLYVITADLAGVAAWLARDLRDYEGAWACFEAGMRAAQEAGDYELYAYLLAGLGHVATDLRGAANMLIGAEIAAQKVATPSTYAWITGAAAQKLAAVKDVATSRAMLQKAERATNQTEGGEQPRWVYHWGHSRFLRHQGCVELHLNQPQVAQAAFEDALSVLHSKLIKLRSAVMADLAVAYFRQRQVDEGCVWTHRAIDLRAEQEDTLRGFHVRELTVALRPYMDIRVAREVVERLGVGSSILPMPGDGLR